jgi:hypothetical protein
MFLAALVLGLIAGCSSKSPEQLKAIESTRTAEEALTAAHENEVRSIIETYLVESGELAVQKEPSRLSEFMTGSMLDAMLSFGTPEPGRSFYVTESVEISEVHVLEYNSSTIKAIGCGKLFTDEVTYEGQYIKSIQPLSIMQIFVFVQEDNVWKVFTRYDFGDTKGALRDWAYVSDEEKQALGDLQTYVDMYWGCGLNLKPK